MASTISTPHFGSFKRIKMQYIAAAAGVALATAAVVGGLTLRSEPVPASHSVTPISVGEYNPGTYPLVQEMSHPQIAPLVSGTADVTAGGFPLVQEMSHPAIPAAAPSDPTTNVGSYPLVQEMSHPR